MFTPESPLQKFQALLGEMLQTEKSDLDFGIYRVVGHRRGDMEDFITKTIPGAVNKAVADSQPHNATVQEKEEIERQIRRDIGENAFTPDGELRPEFAEGEAGKKWHEVCARASGAQLLTDQDVCNRLLQFFGRYYHEGDFVSKRRYAGNAQYAVPYDGREVLLHWANRDQYYVKTADRFAQYAFTADNSAFQFRVEKTAAQKDNNKPPKGEFILADARKENGRVIAVFHRRELSEKEKKEIKFFAKNGGTQQDKIIALAKKQIDDGKFPLLTPLLASHAVQKEKSRFTVHAARFVRRNTSDYFIHRNLRAFLRRELDFFLKNETINADELAENALAQNRIAAFRAVRNVARQVIDMLAQWEDFQKALWEKKKFILQTEYCATLGHIPDWKNCSILKDIADCKKQWEEWKDLGMCDEFSDLFPANEQEKYEERIAFLRENPSLPVDTVHFPPEFKDCLLDYFKGKNGIPGIDDATDGILFHGDNWQTLNLLQEKFRGQVQCIHIDPPYNTNTSGFLYKNDFQHSSWMSMMESRIAAAIPLLSDKGVFQCHIDENEYERLHLLFEQTPTFNAGTVVWDKKNPILAGKGIATQHEYIALRSMHNGAIYLRNLHAKEIIAKAATLIGKHNGVNEKSRKDFASWIDKAKKLSGGERAYCHIDDDGRVFRGVSMSSPNLGEAAAHYYEPLIHPITQKPCPVPDGGWSRTPATMKKLLEKNEILFGEDESVQPQKKIFLTEDSRRQLPSILRMSSRGKQDLRALGGMTFAYCHSVMLYEELIGAGAPEMSDVVVDFFAGSGTAAHAVINLNRTDGGQRKFILAEMGDYFGTVLLPRVKKIIYSPEWKEGKATRPATAEEHKRGPRLVKYHRIESYEDALDNVNFGKNGENEGKDEAMRKLDDFIPRYMLRWESRKDAAFLSDEGLENPFDYKLQLSGEAARTEQADLPETFAYLIGLRVRTRQVLTDKKGRDKPRYVVCQGECGGAETTAIWRDVSGWEEADYERDRKFVEENGLAAGRIWMNGNSLVPDASVLDVEFRERMFPPSVREDAE